MFGGFFNVIYLIVIVLYISEINIRFENYELIVLIFIIFVFKNIIVKMIMV